jgi:putative transposase
MIKAYKYRIYPTKKQEIEFEKILEACRSIYNWALGERKEAYEATGKGLSYFTQSSKLTELKNERPILKDFNRSVLDDVLNRLDKSYKAFFRRVKNKENPGFPRFKGKGRYNSFSYRHLSKKLIIPTNVKLFLVEVPNLGKVKILLDRPLIQGKIKRLHIIRKQSSWYASISIEVNDIPKKEISSVIGVDVGLESFLTTSEGEKVENPRHLRIAEEKLKMLQRKLSRCKIGSKRRGKAKKLVGKHHERIANRRKDFHFKVAHNLYSRYDTVGVEDLQIPNMVKNHHLAKSISDAGWGNFLLALANKAENAGCHLVKVSPQGTSQLCSGCGATVQKLLSVRTHNCGSCGCVLDRDHNAAINIKQRIASILRGGIQTTVPETLSQKRKIRETSKTQISFILKQTQCLENTKSGGGS